jgi:hypothetical protein
MSMRERGSSVCLARLQVLKDDSPLQASKYTAVRYSHQERIQLYLHHLVFATPLLLSAAIVEELEPV